MTKQKKLPKSYREAYESAFSLASVSSGSFVIRHKSAGYFTGQIAWSPMMLTPIFDRDINGAEVMTEELADKFLNLYKNADKCEKVRLENCR